MLSHQLRRLIERKEKENAPMILLLIACASGIVFNWKQCSNPGTPWVLELDPQAITNLSYGTYTLSPPGVSISSKRSSISMSIALAWMKPPRRRARVRRRGSTRERASTVPTVADGRRGVYLRSRPKGSTSEDEQHDEEKRAEGRDARKESSFGVRRRSRCNPRHGGS